MPLEFPMTELDASVLLAMKAYKETLPVITRRLNIHETRLLDMIEGKEPLSRCVIRDLGLRRQIRYRIK